MMDTTLIQDCPARGRTGMRLPESFGRFTVLSRIADGGMGTVLFAIDSKTLESAAIKTVEPDAPVWHSDFLQDEAETLAKLRHPGVPRLIEADFASGHPYLAMEFIGGETLSATVATGPAMFAEMARVLPRLLDALGAVHSAGLVHRDVKPANIILANDGRVVLVDFGLAGAAGEHGDCLAGFVLGTPLYMAPEQYWLDAPEDARTDLFAFGCLLYELLTGVHPFGGVDTEEIMRRIDANRPQPPSVLRAGISPELDELVLSLLARRQDDRPASAAEVRACLEGALSTCVDAPRWLDIERLRAEAATRIADVPGRRAS